jgi:diguanylate cyclase (GGDEF)-like protein
MFYSWRFYTLGREQYAECMNKVFSNNLMSLRQASYVFSILAGGFSAFPIFIEKDIRKAVIYFAAAIISLLLALFVNYIMQKADISNRFIYLLISLFYTNVMAFGTYLSVWSNPDDLASIYFCFLICALLMFANSPLYNFFLTLGAMFVFMVSSSFIKSPDKSVFDIANALIAGTVSLYFSWHITRLRLGLELNASKLEEERNKYLDQSILDELTQLRNRRDFMQTFQRYVVNFRTTDDWLCIGIADIDFFKGYNDHYGHPKGDDCLRSIGVALNSLKESMGVYTARVGGEEFALLWFEKEAAHVDDVVHHLMNLIKELKMPHEKSKASEYVTMSIGVFVVRCGAYNNTQVLYDLADKALYNAKAGGRNCAIICGDEIKEYKITPPEEIY